MKWIRRILIALLALLVILVVGMAGAIGIDAATSEGASAFTNVTYINPDGVPLNAYLAVPDGEGPFPGVLMIHEWWGMRPEIVEKADKLAAEGYAVLAPDTYRGASTTIVPRALFLRLSTPEARVDGDMQTAFEYLASHEAVDPARIGVVGFCYGGGVALRHAIRNPQIAATINLYGSTPDDPASFGALLNDGTGPVLGIFGEDDAQIPLSEVEAFEAALTAADIPHTITIYADVGHAFVQPDAIAEGGAAAEAWNQILAFFAAHLQQRGL